MGTISWKMEWGIRYHPDRMILPFRNGLTEREAAGYHLLCEGVPERWHAVWRQSDDQHFRREPDA